LGCVSYGSGEKWLLTFKVFGSSPARLTVDHPPPGQRGEGGMTDLYGQIPGTKRV